MSQPITIPLNKPFLTGRETEYIREAVLSGKIAGDGLFTQRCQAWFRERFGFTHSLLTTSCTDALELAALVLDIREGDEVIVPAYTFVSTANAFVLRGAKLVFTDSLAEHPNIDPAQVEALITPRTRALVVVHYAGMSCDMDALLAIARRHNIALVEDAAQAIGTQHSSGKLLGSMGDLATFSFHETKNVIAGEGGMLVVNRPELMRSAEIIREKGTNRSAFFRGETARYEWIAPGSSFLPSDIIAAFLFAQLEQFDAITAMRVSRWQRYADLLQPLAASGAVLLPVVPACSSLNGNIFYLLCRSREERDALIMHLRETGIYAAFHYLCLHNSPYFRALHDGRTLPNAERFEHTLIRLPMYHELQDTEQDLVCAAITEFFAHYKQEALS